MSPKGMAAPGKRKHILLLTSPRTRSNLTFRWLCTSPEAYAIQYPFITASRYGKSENCLAFYLRHGKERHEELLKHQYGDDTHENCIAVLSKNIQDAEQSRKVAVIIEQWDHLVKLQQGLDILRVEDCKLDANPTYYPDDLLLSLKPVILIRHPLPVVESLYRLLQSRKIGLADEDFHMASTTRTSRLLFDHFTALGTDPIVVDSWDILNRTDHVANKLGSLLGIEAMTDKWTPKKPEEVASLNPLVAGAQAHINASSGFDRPVNAPAAEADSCNFYQQWQEKYGEDVARQLRQIADKNMTDYNYLRQFKL